MKNLNVDPKSIKKAIICKNVNSTTINEKINKTHIPKAGDVAVFRVMEIGKHTRLQTIGGNLKYILPGDLIMAAFGNRYATEQLEGYVPNSYQETYHILGQGGAIGVLTSIHKKLEDVGPTSLQLVGYVVENECQVINTKYLGYEPLPSSHLSINSSPQIILSLGTSMDSGKTTSAAFLARGIKQAGKKAAYIKLTGTVQAKDKSMVRDYGAELSIDFSDLGFPSTYMCSSEEILALFEQLLSQVKAIRPDYIIVEVADGLLQRETNALIRNARFNKLVAGVIFSSSDSISAISGANMLLSLGYNVIGVSGLFTTSPLLVKEVSEQSNHQVLDGENLMSEEVLKTLTHALNHGTIKREMASAV